MPAGHCRALTEHFGVATLFILEGLWIPLFQSLAFAVMKALLSLQGSNVAVLVRGTGEAQGAQHSTGAMYDRFAPLRAPCPPLRDSPLPQGLRPLVHAPLVQHPLLAEIQVRPLPGWDLAPGHQPVQVHHLAHGSHEHPYITQVADNATALLEQGTHRLSHAVRC